MIDTLTKYSERITSEQMTREFENDLSDIKDHKITENNVIEEAKLNLKEFWIQ